MNQCLDWSDNQYTHPASDENAASLHAKTAMTAEREITSQTA